MADHQQVREHRGYSDIHYNPEERHRGYSDIHYEQNPETRYSGHQGPRQSGTRQSGTRQSGTRQSGQQVVQQEYRQEEVPQYKHELQEYAPHIHPRILYLRKLYFMLFVQLSIVAIVTYAAWSSADFKKFLAENAIIFILALVLSILMTFVCLFFRKAASKVPFNWVAFILFTVGLSFTFAYSVAVGDSDIALMIFLMADAVVFALFVYALTTKIELTYQGASLFVLGALLFIFQVFLIFTVAQFDRMVLVSMAEIIFAFYLIYDTQTMVSGTKYDYESEDWISGAVVVYADVFLLFLRLCELVRQLVVRERN